MNAHPQMLPEAVDRGPQLQTSAAAEPDQQARVRHGATNQEFAMIRDGYHIRIANGAMTLQNQIASLLERMYSTRGLRVYHPEPAQTNFQTTIVACRGDHVFATLTLGLDAPTGLMADTLYGPEVDAVRARGGRICEVTRMAMDPEHNSSEVMADMFQLVYVIARRIYRMTDLFIEVHPRHAGFYRRMLGSRIIGEERVCPRVGAPAVLMRTSQHEVDELIAKHSGKDATSTRSLYRLFAAPAKMLELERKLVG